MAAGIIIRGANPCATLIKNAYWCGRRRDAGVAEFRAAVHYPARGAQKPVPCTTQGLNRRHSKAMRRERLVHAGSRASGAASPTT